MHNLFFPNINEKIIIDAEFNSASSVCKVKLEKIPFSLDDIDKEKLDYVVECDLLFLFSECYQTSV